MSAPRELFRSEPPRNLLCMLALVAASLLLYQPAIRNGFVNFDDNFYVLTNVHVATGLKWKNIAWAFSAFYMDNWHPLTWISHMADAQWFGLRPAGHHLMNIFLHALNGALLFAALKSLTGRVGRSFAVAALWAMHPLNVESVAWVAERKNLLSTTFWLAGILLYCVYVRRPGWRRYLAVMAALIAGLMSKPMLVTFPFGLMLLDYWPLRRFEAGIGSRKNLLLLAEKIPMLILCAISSWITFHAQHAGGAVLSADVVPLDLRLKNAIVSYVAYVGQALWPAKLSVFYPYPVTYGAAKIAAGLALLCVITIVVFAFRRRGYLISGWLWFLGTMVPVIGLVQVGVQARADRYMYVPMIGLLLAIVWAAADLAEKFHVSKNAVAVLGSCAVLALAAVSYRQLRFWHDSTTLWTHALKTYPLGNYTAQVNLAAALVTEGRAAEATPYFEAVLQRFPQNAKARSDFAISLLLQGKPQAAIAQSQRALQFAGQTPLAATIYTTLGSAEAQISQRAEAEVSYQTAIHISPEFVNAYLGLGGLLADEGRATQAAQVYSRSLEVMPTSNAYRGLGRLLLEQNKVAEARQAFAAGEQLRAQENP